MSENESRLLNPAIWEKTNGLDFIVAIWKGSWETLFDKRRAADPVIKMNQQRRKKNVSPFLLQDDTQSTLKQRFPLIWIETKIKSSHSFNIFLTVQNSILSLTVT